MNRSKFTLREDQFSCELHMCTPRNRSDFTDEEIMEILMREINPVLKFLEESEHVEKNPSGRVKGKDLYDAYVKWSVEKGFKVVGLSEFYSIVGSKYQSYDREGAKWFRGLRLKR